MIGRSYYEEHIGGDVIVYTDNNNSHCGRLIAANHETIQLCPCLVSEPKFFITNSGELGRSVHFRIERTRPSVTNTLDVITVEPLEETCLNEMGKVFKEFDKLQANKPKPSTAS